MSDHIDVQGDIMGLLSATAVLVQSMQEQFETMAEDCDNSNGHGGCLINTADGCHVLGCPLSKEDN